MVVIETHRMVVLNNAVDQQGMRSAARYAVEVTSYQHGDVSTGCYLLKPLEKSVHLRSVAQSCCETCLDHNVTYRPHSLLLTGPAVSTNMCLTAHSEA